MSSVDNDQQLVLKPNAVQEFKKPVGVPTRSKKKKILDEETYIHELEKIIERDFFPDLDNLKDKIAFLEARENNDLEMLQMLHRKYTLGNKPDTQSNVEDSPATFDTPVHPSKDTLSKKILSPARNGDSNSDIGDKSNPSDSTSISLDSFLTKHTSEDDESFEKILDDQRRALIEKKSWLFDAATNHNEKYAPNLKMKALPANEHQARMLQKKEQEQPRALENWNYETFNAVMYVPEGHHPSKERLMEIAEKGDRVIVHSNTRFNENPFVKPLNQATVMEATAVQAFKKEGKIGVDGRELSKQTPRVRGYSFVGDASPAPGVEESPLMTWGEVEGTPFQLDRGSTPLIHSTGSTPSYSIPKISQRDVIAMQLADKVNQSQKDKKSKALSAARSSLITPNSRGRKGQWSTQRLSSMSPAARRLLSTGLGIHRSTDQRLRGSLTPTFSSFTPSPYTRKASSGTSKILTPSSLRKSKFNATPKSQSLSSLGSTSSTSSKTSAVDALTSGSGLTDGLLQLPKRKESTGGSPSDATQKRACAADFF